MRNLWQDLRYGIRTLWKRPGFTLVAVLALALGIAANTTIFGAINALLLKPFAFREMDRIVSVFETVPQIGVERGSVAPANFRDIRSQSTSFETLAASTGWSANLTEDDRPERITGAAVTSGFFELFGVSLKLGSGFAAEEEQPGRAAVVVIGEDLWRRRFNADPNVVGRNVRINETNFTVVGVAPKELAYPRGGVEMWRPFVFDEEDVRDRESHYLRVSGRLKPGVSAEGAAGEMETLARTLAGQFPETNEGRGLRVTGFLETETGGPRPYLLIALGAVVFVLLISCANVANLLLLRATERSHEIAVRTALGASRLRIVRQLLTESVLLALAGGLTGLILSVWFIDALAAGMPADFARLVSGWSNLGVDWNVFGFTLLLSLATGVIFGLFPAWQASKTDLNEALKEGGRGVGAGKQGRARNRTRNLLVVTEVALSLVLLAGAGLMVRSFVKLMNVEPGFKTENALTFGVALPRTKYKEAQQRVGFQRQLIERLAMLPGVSGVGAVNNLPLGFDGSDTFFWRDGQPAPQRGQAPLANVQVISDGYFGAMGIPLHAGRAFDTRDTEKGTPVLIINRALAEKYFKGEEPLGRSLRLGSGDKPYQIVGIVGDVRHEPFSDNLSLEPELAVYQPHAQNAWSQMMFVVRADGTAAAAVTPAVRRELQALDKDQPIFNVLTMDQVFVISMAPQRLSSFMFGGFALIALLIAAVGIYAVVAYTVAQRTHEIGIRMALGAQRGDIMSLVVGQGMKLIAFGIGAGLLASLAVTRLMASILYGVSSTDFVTFAAISVLLAGVAAVACYVPARRAAKVDPMEALRYE
ncbi:MAG: ABC transporter permease [Pyrinomonadaceae bacterium]|nr:ABC transporter permease [Pyrinomonadaceae bacterium]